MDREKLVTMARDAGMVLTVNQHGNTHFSAQYHELAHFAAQVARLERQECMKLVVEPHPNPAIRLELQRRASLLRERS